MNKQIEVKCLMCKGTGKITLEESNKYKKVKFLKDLPASRGIKGVNVRHPKTGDPVILQSVFVYKSRGRFFWCKKIKEDTDTESICFYCYTLKEAQNLEVLEW